jgi:hypothetical protein
LDFRKTVILGFLPLGVSWFGIFWSYRDTVYVRLASGVWRLASGVWRLASGVWAWIGNNSSPRVGTFQQFWFWFHFHKTPSMGGEVGVGVGVGDDDPKTRRGDLVVYPILLFCYFAILLFCYFAI